MIKKINSNVKLEDVLAFKSLHNNKKVSVLTNNGLCETVNKDQMC